MNFQTMLDSRGKYTRISIDKCGSLWFNRFMNGMKTRMGTVWKPNKDLSIKLMLMAIQIAEDKILEAINERIKDKWIVFATYIIISYVLSLRGYEGLMLDLGGLRKQWNIKRAEYVTIVLFGKLKGETTHREHFIPCANQTKSGINIKATLDRLIRTKERQAVSYTHLTLPTI